jgi:NAD(P)-dependent dehydrogenase (short-subunit alcohol dehydrogenase family)
VNQEFLRQGLRLTAFRGPKVIVIGGTSGMGISVARIVLERGDNAVVIGKHGDRLQSTIAELSQCGVMAGRNQYN